MVDLYTRMAEQPHEVVEAMVSALETRAGDPLQSAIDAVFRNMVHAPYIMRHLPALARKAGCLKR